MKRRHLRMARHRLRRLSQVGLREQRLLVEATLRLATARLALATVPFPRLARAMGGFVAPHDARALAVAAPPTLSDQALALEVGWAVTRAARHVPFAAVCLPQALAARAMLHQRRVFSIIHFGTARGETVSLKAHAWLDVGPVEVTGFPVGAEFTEIACLAG